MVTLLAACNNHQHQEKTGISDSVKATESPLMDAVNTADSASKIINTAHDSAGQQRDTVMKK